MKRILYGTTITVLLLVALAAPATFHAQSVPPPAKKASAIQVLMITSDEIKLPAEFQISLYENLIQQLEKQGGFQHVFREGDRHADGATDLVVLHSTVRGFKKVSEMARNVTTVPAQPSMDINSKFTDKHGRRVLDRDLTAKFQFFGV